MTVWAELEREAADLERQARSLRRAATRTRCDAQESGGVQCTGDRGTPHEHRYEEGDMP